MILLVGQVAREAADREAFQEIDYRRMFGQMAKWVAQIEDARRIPELVSQAFHTALNGRPGPVVLALPEDMLVDEVEVADAGPYKIARGAPAPDDMATLRELLAAAERPMVILGGGGWSAEACADIRAFVEANDLPVCASFRNQDLFDNRHPNYVGDLGVGVGPALGKRAQGLRPHHRRRPAARRGDDRRLHAVRPAGAEAEAGACPCRRRGAGPRLSGDACRSTAAWRTSPPPPRR